MATDNEEKLFSLKWYVDCKDRVLMDILAGFFPPANGDEMRLTYGLYFMHLMSLAEAVREYCPKSPQDRMTHALDGLGGNSGENNYRYLRETRNAVVHRGWNIAETGRVDDAGRVRLLAPPGDRVGRGVNPPVAFAEYLDSVIMEVEARLGPSIELALTDAGFWDETRTSKDLQEEAWRFVFEHPQLPDHVKKARMLLIDGESILRGREKFRSDLRASLEPKDIAGQLGMA
ncbi:hypothetical protein [Achromobacter sp. UMC71]|uniref:hypothetical protein n=1 Tax=Achromobacter sp. UMC71 TaxID=1862320 RepID=UPI0016005641|nr:hypothetical protein [Achromobacter sp. UMC71]